MAKAERIGKVAHIRYKGGAKGEEPLDDRSTGNPLTVVLGEGRIPKGIENCLYEMEVGEQRTVEIPCSLGYGEHRDEGVQWYPRTIIDKGYKLKVGDVITTTSREDGSMLPARIVAETEDLVQVDVNHPFAGKTLEYWLELVDLR